MRLRFLTDMGRMRSGQLLAILTITLLSLGAAAILGYWPAIIVDGTWILFRDVKINTSLATSYYTKIADAYGAATGGDDEVVIDGDALRQGVRGELIEGVLIHKKLREELGDEVLRGMVEDRVARAREDIFGGGGESLYGASPEMVVSRIFIPQAERDILGGIMSLRGENFEVWILDARRNARVTLFLPGAEWIP